MEPQEEVVDSRVIVISLRKAQLFIGNPYLSKKCLSELFEIEDTESVVLLDPEGEEADYDEDGNFFCDTTKHYTVVTEDDIDSENDPEFTQLECYEHIQRVDAIRRKFVLKNWTPRHSWLYSESPEEIFISQLSPIESLIHVSADIYKLDNYFSEKFRVDFLEEVIAMEKSGLPYQQPNTMNRYGLIFADFGLTHLFNFIYSKFQSVVEKFYSKITHPIDSNHAFLVQYKPNQQKSLGLHVDDSSFTINLCLENTNPDEGELYFVESETSSMKVKNLPGTAVLHYGNQMHGACPIESGKRYNLIIWYKESQTCDNKTCTHHHHT